MGPRRDVVGGGEGGEDTILNLEPIQAKIFRSHKYTTLDQDGSLRFSYFLFFKILLFIGFLLRAVFPFINEWWFWNLFYFFVSQIYHWFILITWPLKTRSKVLLFKGLLTNRRKFEKIFWSTKHYFNYQNSVLSCFWLQSIIPE